MGEYNTLIQVLTVIMSVVIVAGVTILIYLRYKKSEKGKEEATEFLDGLKTTLYNQMIQIIINFDYDNQETLVNIETEIINKMVTSAKDYIKAEITKSDDALSLIALKILSDDFIEKFVKSIVNNINIFEEVEYRLRSRNDDKIDEYIKEDNELQKQYNNKRLYYETDVEVQLPNSNKSLMVDSDNNGLQERGFVLPSKEEESKLNPQKEEEESYDATDESMELIIEEDKK